MGVGCGVTRRGAARTSSPSVAVVSRAAPFRGGVQHARLGSCERTWLGMWVGGRRKRRSSGSGEAAFCAARQSPGGVGHVGASAGGKCRATAAAGAEGARAGSANASRAGVFAARAVEGDRRRPQAPGGRPEDRAPTQRRLLGAFHGRSAHAGAANSRLSVTRPQVGATVAVFAAVPGAGTAANTAVVARVPRAEAKRAGLVRLMRRRKRLRISDRRSPVRP